MKTKNQFARLIERVRKDESIEVCALWGLLRKLGMKSYDFFKINGGIPRSRVEAIIEETSVQLINTYLQYCDSSEAADVAARAFRDAFEAYVYHEEANELDYEFRDPFYPTLARLSPKNTHTGFSDADFRYAA